LNATCNTATGLIAQVRTKAGNCDVSVTTTQDAPCCQLGPWVSGTCQPDGTITRTRSVSTLCPSKEVSKVVESCWICANGTEVNSKNECGLCPDGLTEINTDGSNCPKCLDNTTFADASRSNCAKCPDMVTETDNNNTGCPKCADDATLMNEDGSNCPVCANGDMAKIDRNNCPLCKDGVTESIVGGLNCPRCFDGQESLSDRSNCLKCPDGITETDYDYSNCPYCLDGQLAEIDRRNCLLCPNSTTEKNADGSNCFSTISEAAPVNTQDSTGNDTTFYAAGGAAAAGLAVAAGVFYLRQGKTVTAQILDREFTENQNMNPVYEGMQLFENALYDPNEMDLNLSDGFPETKEKLPEA
jgi:hypothetical protein